MPVRDREADQRWKPLIDPMKVIGGIARSRNLILVTTLAGALLGLGLALSATKKFEATTELIADPRNLQITDHDLTQSSVASDTTLAIVENQVRVLTSGSVLDKVAEKLNLFEDPEFNGQKKGFPGVMTLIRSVISRNDASEAAGEERLRAIVVRNLAESLSVERGGKTFVISISAKTENGEKSALIANTMAEVFLDTYGRMQSDTASRATDELTGRLDELRKTVETAERKLETFKAEHDLVDAQGRLISDDELLKLNDQLTVARTRTLELNAKAASARGVNVDSVVAGTLPEEISSDAMNDLRSQYARLKQEADRAGVRLGPRHPDRLALDAQLAGARDRIGAELNRIASSLQTDLKRAVELEQQLSARLAQLKVRSGDVNNDLVTARELEREVNAKRAVYESFLLRAKQTGEQKDINTANISVISKAYAPLDPTGPSRALTVIAGLLLGFASGIGLGAMRGAYESLRDTADGRAQRQRAASGEAGPQPSPSPAADGLLAHPLVPAANEPNPIGRLRAAIGGALRRDASTDASATAEADEGWSAQLRSRPEERAGLAEGAPLSSEPLVQEPEKPMYPPYPYPNMHFGAQPTSPYPQPHFQPTPQFPQGMYPQQPYPPQASYPGGVQPMPPQQGYYPAPPHYPYAPPMGYPQAQPWPSPAATYPQPMHVQPMHPQAMPPQPAQMAYQPPYEPPRAQPMRSPAEDPAPIEEIRASLREFRDAVRDLTESRTRRRYF